MQNIIEAENPNADNIRNKAVEDFITARYKDRGTLKVQVSTAKGLFPVEGSIVEVATNINGRKTIIYRLVTDNSGIVDNIILPANPSSESQRSQTATGSGVNYLVSVSHPLYVDRTELPVTIFNNVVSILLVDLIPLFSGEGR